MEDHTILKEIPEFKSSVSRLLGKVDASRLFWWVVHNFCVKYCTVVPCESLSTDAESETAVSLQSLSDQKEKGRCTQHPINKTITLFQFHLITEYNQKEYKHRLHHVNISCLRIVDASCSDKCFFFCYLGLGFLLSLLLVVCFLESKTYSMSLLEMSYND